MSSPGSSTSSPVASTFDLPSTRATSAAASSPPPHAASEHESVCETSNEVRVNYGVEVDKLNSMIQDEPNGDDNEQPISLEDVVCLKLASFCGLHTKVLSRTYQDS